MPKTRFTIFLSDDQMSLIEQIQKENYLSPTDAVKHAIVYCYKNEIQKQPDQKNPVGRPVNEEFTSDQLCEILGGVKTLKEDKTGFICQFKVPGLPEGNSFGVLMEKLGKGKFKPTKDQIDVWKSKK